MESHPVATTSRTALFARRRAAQQVAVVDCGTSSVRAFIAEAEGQGHRILEDLVFPVDLTRGFIAGKLDRESMDGVVQACAGIVAAAKAYGITELRAVGTSAFREAANSDVLIERLRSRLGINLEIIDIAEEARLYCEALRLLLKRDRRRLPGNALLIDLGAGSTCTSLIRAGKLVHSVDEHFGTVRLFEQFKELKDSTDFSITIDRYALGVAQMMLGRLPRGRVNHLVVTGSDVRRLYALLRPGVKALIEPLSATEIAAWHRRMQGLTPLARAEACGCDQRAAALLLPAASLIRHLCRETGAGRVLVPHLTLRDGLLADLLPGANGPHYLDARHLMAEARQLVERYHGNLAYAQNTASLAVQLFDQTKELHGLGERERTLLEFSALVHDLGSYLNVRNRHKHTMYIIQNADIAGLTQIEKDMVANVARYHRRSQPEAHHLEFQSLPRRNRVVVSYLAAILRLAYALDVERTQRIKRVRAEVQDNRLLLRVDQRQVALERWSVEDKSGMFAEVFGLSVVVVPREEA
jgi:exopolyphosphatase/guanosine-5'-triphosphate,3'-diphosphate pyrophosphatase